MKHLVALQVFLSGEALATVFDGTAKVFPPGVTTFVSLQLLFRGESPLAPLIRVNKNSVIHVKYI